jgi:hypothetical protein
MTTGTLPLSRVIPKKEYTGKKTGASSTRFLESVLH